MSVPATRMAIDRLNDRIVANVIMLGAAVEITQVVTKESLEHAVEGKRSTTVERAEFKGGKNWI